MRSTIILVCLLFITGYCFSQSKSVNSIKELNKEMEDYFNRNEMQNVSAFYFDSSVISGGRMRITGRSGIDNYWQMMKDKGYNWKLVVDSIEDYGQIVIQNGKSYLTKTENGAEKQMNTRFLLIWKKTGDSYKILYDLFSSL